MTEGPVPIESPPVTWRVLFTDGRVIDFTGRSDSSDVRGQMLRHATATGSDKDVRIEGLVTVDDGTDRQLDLIGGTP